MITIPKERILRLDDRDLRELYGMSRRWTALQRAEAAVAVLKPQVDADIVLVQQWLGEEEADAP